jgi:hypothetical protein
MLFAPYTVNYPGLSQHLTDSGLVRRCWCRCLHAAGVPAAVPAATWNVYLFFSLVCCVCVFGGYMRGWVEAGGSVGSIGPRIDWNDEVNPCGIENVWGQLISLLLNRG